MFNKFLAVFCSVVTAVCLTINFCVPRTPAEAQAPPTPIAKKQEDNTPYIAVYGQKGFEFFWENENVDFTMFSDTWEDLDDFVDKVNKKAKGREVIIAIDCHGTSGGFLCLAPDFKEPCYASMGYLLNQLDRVKKLRFVTMEACFAAHAMATTRVNVDPDRERGSVYENHPAVPTYPIYGVNNVVNWGNAVWAQVYEGEDINIHDLREYISEPPGELIGDQDWELKDPRTEVLCWFYIAHSLSQGAEKKNIPFILRDASGRSLTNN